jgi:hypothetical protein
VLGVVEVEDHDTVTTLGDTSVGRRPFPEFPALQVLFAPHPPHPILAVDDEWSSTVALSEGGRTRQGFEAFCSRLAIVAIANHPDNGSSSRLKLDRPTRTGSHQTLNAHRSTVTL